MVPAGRTVSNDGACGACAGHRSDVITAAMRGADFHHAGDSPDISGALDRPGIVTGGNLGIIRGAPGNASRMLPCSCNRSFIGAAGDDPL